MKRCIEKMVSVVVTLVIAVGATSFTKLGDVKANGMGSQQILQEQTALNEESVEKVSTETSQEPDSNGEAVIVTKDGDAQEFDTETKMEGTPFDLPMYFYHCGNIVIRPTYMSVDESGHITYKEGSSCLSVSDHGYSNHQKVHLWDNKQNEIYLGVCEDDCYIYHDKLCADAFYLRDDTGIGAFKTFEVSDDSSAPHKALRGHSTLEATFHKNKPWQVFHFDTCAKLDNRNAYVVRIINNAGNLPIGLKDEQSAKNGNEVETKEAGAQNLWVVEVISGFDK